MSRPVEDPTGAIRAALDRLAGLGTEHVPIALGWATVELDRIERSFAETWPGSVTVTTDLGVDELLGAYCRLLSPGIDGVPALLLLEPATEGRLAASLARHGEGPMAIWLAESRELALPPAAATTRRSVATPGPFGTEALLLDGPVHGPHRLVVLAGPGTITP